VFTHELLRHERPTLHVPFGKQSSPTPPSGLDEVPLVSLHARRAANAAKLPARDALNFLPG
jgi:hypothetical protein